MRSRARLLRHGRRRLLVRSATMVCLLGVGGCGGAAESLAAGDVRVLVGERSSGGMDGLLTGRLAVIGPCLGVRSAGLEAVVVVWPEGTEVARAEPLSLELPDGGSYGLGDEVEVAGGRVRGATVGGLTVPDGCRVAPVWLAN